MVFTRLTFPLTFETTFSLTDFVLQPFGISSSVSKSNISIPEVTSSFQTTSVIRLDDAYQDEMPISHDIGEIESTTLLFDDWQFISWILGVSLFGAFFICNYWKSHQKIRCAIPIHNDVLDRWKSAHQLKRPIQILTSDQITTPVTVGILKPKIIVPVEMDCSQNLHYMLEHEFYHIKRWDALWKVLMITIACLHWFNPLVWVMCILANRDLEISCDGWVMNKFGKNNKKTYASILIKMAEQRNEFVPFYNGFAKHAVEERIESIMSTKKITWISIGVAAVIISVLSLNAFATLAEYEEDAYEFDEASLMEEEVEEYLDVNRGGMTFSCERPFDELSAEEQAQYLIELQSEATDWCERPLAELSIEEQAEALNKIRSQNRERHESQMEELPAELLESVPNSFTINSHYENELQPFVLTAEDASDYFIDWVLIWHYERLNDIPLIDFEGTRFELTFFNNDEQEEPILIEYLDVTDFKNDQNELHRQTRLVHQYLWSGTVYAPESDEVIATFVMSACGQGFWEVTIKGQDLG